MGVRSGCCGTRTLAGVWMLSRTCCGWQAEEFHTLVHAFLGRLTESEKTLKFGVFPEEELAVQECQNQLEVGASPHPPLAPGWPHTPEDVLLLGPSWPQPGCAVAPC